MLQADGRVRAALRSGDAQHRANRRRIRWLWSAAASYAVDTLFLGLFALAGTVPAQLALLYGAAAAAVSALACLAYTRGWNLRWRDPNLTQPLLLAAVLLQLAVAMAAPQIAFPFLANLFTVFAFGMMWLNLRDAGVVWLSAVFGAAVVFYAVGHRFAAPASSGVEIALSWTYFSLILGRSLLVSVASNDMRARLAQSRRQLSDTLDQVQRLASRDELTRALNRRALLTALERERSRSERSGTPFCVAMIDLDHFKSVNDTHGHGAGDAVLRAFADTVHERMRATDVFGRYGGEEFMMVLVDAAPAQALEAIERVRLAVAARDWRAEAPDARVTMSAGIAAYRKGEPLEQVLRRADLALYRAKREGRNRSILMTEDE